MPNRIISAGILTSDSLSQLSWFDQCVFFRLLVLADDYGRYDARPAVIRGQAFSLYDVTNKDIQSALSRLAAVGIVSLYEVGGKPYLQLEHWSQYQRLRNSKAKYPAPENCRSADSRGNSPQLAANCGLESNPNPNPNPNPNTPPLPPNGGLGVAADADLGRVFACYEQTIGTPARHMVDEMRDYLQAMSPDVICLAIQEAANHGARNWAYITSILRRCRDTGIRSSVDWEAAESARNKGARQPEGKRSPVEEARLKLRQIAGGEA